MKRFFVFAFGSNLDADQMGERCPSARFYSRGVLEGYALQFAGYSRRWRGGVATLKTSSSGRTPGVVYRVSEDDLEALDRFEGHPHVYERITARAKLESGATFFCYVYQLQFMSKTTNLPSFEYLAAIRRGYDAWSLPRRTLLRALERSASA